MMEHSYASNDVLASTTASTIATAAATELDAVADNNTAPTRTDTLQTAPQSPVQLARLLLPSITSGSDRVALSHIASTTSSRATSERHASSTSRFQVTDAALDTSNRTDSSRGTSVAPQPLTPRLGPSLTRRNIVRESSRGDMLRKDTSQLMQITQGVRRRMSNVLKYAGIDIDTETDKLKQLWQTFDSDGDGTIDYQEFCKYTVDLLEVDKAENGEAATLTMIETRLIQMVTLESKRCASLEKAIEKIFRKLDTNRSGQLSLIEFMEGIRELGLLTYNFEVHGHKRRLANNSLFLFDTKNRFRYALVWLVEWKWFDRFILLCIVMNSCILAFRDYEDPGALPDMNGAYHLNMRNIIVEQSEKIFSWIFFSECVLKIVAMGFTFGRGAYLRSYWNQLDFFVVVVGFISDLPGVPKITALRTARVLRPLRTLSNLRGMRILIYALFSALPALFNVLMIIGFVFTVFGILGMLFWNGKLHYRCRATPAPVNGTWPLAGDGRLCGGEYLCNPGEYCGSVFSLPPNTSVDFDLLPSNELWDYKFSGFDNIGFAILTLFQCITLEGWTSVMYNFQDAHNWAFASLYFVIFTIIGAFFLLQFVFAVIWERFKAVNDGTAENWDLILEERVASIKVSPRKAAAGHDSTSSENNTRQPRDNRTLPRAASFRRSVTATIKMVKKSDLSQRLQQKCRTLVGDPFFTSFIVLCILVNTVCLAMDEYPVNLKRTETTEAINIALTIVFSIEMVMKFAGLGMRSYFADNYNLFDGVIVAVSLIELTVNLSNPAANNNTGLSALRSFRFFRIMKLARSWKSLRELLVTIGNSILDVANFGLLLLLLMYVFALIGMQFFATTYRFDDEGNPVVWEPHVYNHTVPPHAPWTPERSYTISRSNFDDTLSAFTTVFQCLTEESWNFVMYDGVRSVGWGAVMYFLGVMAIGNIIILNLFLAILLGNFSLDEQQSEVDVALVKGQQKIIDAIANSPPIRRLSTVLPFGPHSNAHAKPVVSTSVAPIAADHPPFLHQDMLSKRNTRIRRRSSQVGSRSSSRRLLDLDGDGGDATSLRSQIPQRRIGSTDNAYPSRSPSLRNLSPKAKLPEVKDAEEHGDSVDPTPSTQVRSMSPHMSRLPNDVVECAASPGSQSEAPSFRPKPRVSFVSDRAEAETGPINPSLMSSLPRHSLAAALRESKSTTRVHPETASTVPAGATVSQTVHFKRLSVSGSSLKSPAERRASLLLQKHEAIVHDPNRSLCLFQRSGFVRRSCHAVSRSPYFEHLVLAVIFVSSILLAVDNPLNDPGSRQSIILGITDNIFNAIFLVEMVLKVVDLGFVLNGPKSYLRDPWNVLDLTILAFSGATLVSSSKTLRSLRSFRTLRALRPLRFISRVPGMKRVVNAMLSSIPSILNVFLVCSLIFLIFGILGVNFFKGRLYYCDLSALSSEHVARLEATYGFTRLSFKQLFSKADCVAEGGVWTLRRRHYNNVLKSAMTLFELATTEGWIDIMYEGVDATEIDHHPVENYHRAYVVFFIAFIIIGSFFTLNLFVGAVIDNFNRMRDSLESTAQNETQREWAQIQDMIRSTKLKFTIIEPRHPVRRLCYAIQQHSAFEGGVAVCVLANTTMLAVTHFQESAAVERALWAGNLLFCGVFLLEAVVKLLAMGKKYFFDKWNVFDFLVVAGSTASTVLPLFMHGKVSPVANTVRALRMGLAIRLMKRAKSMQDIVSTILENLPALVNVSTLMCLVMFVYAVIGVQIYAGVMLGDHLDEHANFKDIATAMLTLFRFTTGEAWNDIMYDLMVQPVAGAAPFPLGPSCVNDYSYETLVHAREVANDPRLTIGCTPGITVTYIYFLSYMLVTTYVLLNLFVAVILEGFEEATERHSSTIVKDDLVHVTRIWQGYDLSATGYMSDHAFLRFLRLVPPPLGLPKHTPRKDLERWAMGLDLFVENGKVNFHAFLLAAAQHVMLDVADARGEPIERAKLLDQLFARSQKVMWRTRVRRLSIAHTSSLTAVISVKRIQAVARKGLARKRFLELKRRADACSGKNGVEAAADMSAPTAMAMASCTTTGVVANLAAQIVQSMKVAPAPTPEHGPPLIEIIRDRGSVAAVADGGSSTRVSDANGTDTEAASKPAPHEEFDDNSVRTISEASNTDRTATQTPQ